MAELGLQAVPISTQVVSRLHIADFIYACSSIAAVLERLGKEIRNLQRTEINETAEGFGAGQVGSSTMPQKRNPHKSERVCGLAREVRSALQPSLETVSVEHERDLTNSSVEAPHHTTSCHPHSLHSTGDGKTSAHYWTQHTQRTWQQRTQPRGCKTPVTTAFFGE